MGGRAAPARRGEHRGDRGANPGARHRDLRRILQPATTHLARAAVLWLRALRGHDRGAGLRLSGRAASAGGPAGAVEPRRRHGAGRRLLVLFLPAGERGARRRPAMAAEACRPFHRDVAGQPDARAAAAVGGAGGQCDGYPGRRRPLCVLHDAAVRFGAVVQVRPHVLQAGGRVAEKVGGGGRLVRPAGADGERRGAMPTFRRSGSRRRWTRRRSRGCARRSSGRSRTKRSAATASSPAACRRTTSRRCRACKGWRS